MISATSRDRLIIKTSYAHKKKPLKDVSQSGRVAIEHPLTDVSKFHINSSHHSTTLFHMWSEDIMKEGSDIL